MNGLPYYKAYPRDFIEGTVGMRFELKGAYRLVLDLIYMQGGRLPDDPRYIAGLLGCSMQAWRKYRDELVALEKITVKHGTIRNFRADKELQSTELLRTNMAENRRGKRKTNRLQEQTFNHTESESESDKTPPPPPAREAAPPDPMEGQKGAEPPRPEVSSLPPGPRGEVVPFARPPEPLPADASFRERLIDAMGMARHPSDLRLGDRTDMRFPERWLEAGLTEDDCIRVVAARAERHKRDKPGDLITTFRFFDGAIRDELQRRARAAQPLDVPAPGASMPPAPRTQGRKTNASTTGWQQALADAELADAAAQDHDEALLRAGRGGPGRDPHDGQRLVAGPQRPALPHR